MASLPPSVQSNPQQNVPSTGPNPFTIGSLTFASVDGPSQLAIGGGEQRLSVAELVGGGRVIHTTGFQPELYEWTGTVGQPNVATVVSTLQAYCVDGKPRLMSWRDQKYNGIVRKFPSPIYRNGGNLVTWKVGVEITSDANGAFTTTNGASFDQANAQVLNSANSQFATMLAVTAPTDAQLQEQLAQMNPLLTNVNAAVAGATPVVNATTGQIAAALSSIGLALNFAKTLQAGYSSLDPAYVAAQGLVSSLELLSSNFSTSQVQSTVTQQGGSFFSLAATKYGDVTQAFALMAANGSSASRLPGSLASVIALPPIAGI